MLTPKRRHTKTCSQYGKVGTECPSKSKLKCPYVIEWNEKVNGKRVRKEKSLGTNDYDTAILLVRGMVVSGKKELPGPPKKVEGMTVSEAIDQYFVEETSRGLARSTLKSFHKFLDGNPKRNPKRKYSPTLKEFAAKEGILYLEDFTPSLITKFRGQWKIKSRAMQVQSERLKKFFKYAYDQTWITHNPAAKLQPPVVTLIPVLAFTKQQISRLLDALRDNEFLLTFNLTMRYAGMGTADAIQLGPGNLSESGHISLWRTKTDEHARVLLPPEIVERLKALPVLPGGGWFWNRQGDESDHQTATGNMRRILRPYFEKAKVYQTYKGKVIYDEDGNPKLGVPYMWRHTFVKERRAKGESFDDIAQQLGNSARTVIETYSHFMPETQTKLDVNAQTSWDQGELDSYRLPSDRKTKPVA